MSAFGPHLLQASKTTSVSEFEENRVPPAASSGAQCSVVVQLTVVDKCQTIPDKWLVPLGCQIDNRKSTVRQLNGHPIAFLSKIPRDRGPPVRNASAHIASEILAIRLLIAARNPAHWSVRSRAVSGPEAREGHPGYRKDSRTRR